MQVTATFSETIAASPNPPLISIDYQGLVDVINDTLIEDINIEGSTVWNFTTLIPEGGENTGIAFVTVTAEDRASNQVLGAGISHGDTLLIDNYYPSCVLQYQNISQDYLFDEGKGQDEILIRSDFNKPITQALPLVGITYGDSSGDSFTGLLPDSSKNNDSTFYWAFTLPEGLNNHL